MGICPLGTRIVGLLICTLISENQGLEKSMSISNPRKISGLQTLIWRVGWGRRPEKKSRIAELETFLKF